MVQSDRPISVFKGLLLFPEAGRFVLTVQPIPPIPPSTLLSLMPRPAIVIRTPQGQQRRS